jgi:hypothetical protein
LKKLVANQALDIDGRRFAGHEPGDEIAPHAHRGITGPVEGDDLAPLALVGFGLVGLACSRAAARSWEPCPASPSRSTVWSVPRSTVPAWRANQLSGISSAAR